MNYKHPYLFIICAGRTGSTLLQNLLNIDPKVLIRGENNNFFYSCYKIHSDLPKQFSPANPTKPDTPEHPWYGYQNFRQDKYEDSVRSIGLEFLAGDSDITKIKTIGFKEIRLYRLFCKNAKSDLDSKNKLVKYMNFMDKVFPNNKTIFLARDPNEIIQSGWWSKSNDPELTKKKLATFQKTCLEISKTTNSPYINYKDLRDQNLSIIKSTIHDPLGLPFDEEAVKQILCRRLNHLKKQIIYNCDQI